VPVSRSFTGTHTTHPALSSKTAPRWLASSPYDPPEIMPAECPLYGRELGAGCPQPVLSKDPLTGRADEPLTSPDVLSIGGKF
jgi:hypothetical protein